MIDDIDIINYADDNTPFVSVNTPLHIEHAAEKLFPWFINNKIKANVDKCHLLMNVLTPREKDYTIKNSDNEKLDCRLKNALKNASKKVLILANYTLYGYP